MSIKMIFASTAALAMVAGTPAFAAKNQNQHVAVSEAGGGGDEKAKKVCRSFKNTVSRVKREKLCLTKAEWKKFEQGEL
ncbi:MAG: hypothetical protein WBR13_08740 [Allosphingosinicella sp.]